VKIKNVLRIQLCLEFRDYLQALGLPAKVAEETAPFHGALDFRYFYFDEDGELLSESNRGVDAVIGNPPYESARKS